MSKDGDLKCQAEELGIYLVIFYPHPTMSGYRFFSEKTEKYYNPDKELFTGFSYDQAYAFLRGYEAGKRGK